jgi:hypothetical protein
VPVVVGHAREEPVPSQTGVVDEDVEISGLLDETRRLLRARDVGPDGTPFDLARKLLRLLGPGALADEDVGPRTR